MIVAVILFLGLPVALLLAGAASIVVAAVSLRKRRGRRAPDVLRIIGGAGLLLCAGLALAGVLADVPYAIAVLPLAALVLAAVWALVFFGAARIVAEVSPRRSR